MYQRSLALAASDRLADSLCCILSLRQIRQKAVGERYDSFDQLRSLPNFEFVDAKYEIYPRCFRQMTVFVSVSFLEGGPIPLLEAMMSNVVPVASRTGFGEDVIRHGENGYLFDPYAPTDEVCELIEKAFLLKADVRSTVLRHSWQAFAGEVNRKFS